MKANKSKCSKITRNKAKDMTYKRKAKKKEDFRKNPDKVDTSVRRILLESGKVKILKK